MKVFIEVHGCSANKADSEMVAGLLRKAKFKLVNSPTNSDVNIILTCNVKLPTEQRMLHRIRELTKLGKPLIVGGCMPVTQKELIEKINPKVSLIGPHSIHKIVSVVKETFAGKKIVSLGFERIPKVCLPRVRWNPVVAVVPIAEGCAWQKCAYCIVKFERGKLFSFPQELIVKEVKKSLKDGCKEVWITSQDTACYGIDIGTSLPELLERITKIRGKFFVRVGMMNPVYAKKIVNELIEAYKDEKIFKFLHLPVQSGSNRILKLMRRGYRVRDFVRIVDKFRKAFPTLTLSTDIIVGFPGESERDFKRTLELLKEVKPDIVNVSKFGPRPMTEASKMEPLPVSVVKERSKKVSSLVGEIQVERNERWVGWEGEILIDEIGKHGSVVGRNFAYKPIVIKKKLKLGGFVKVRVVEARGTCLVGKVL